MALDPSKRRRLVDGHIVEEDRVPAGRPRVVDAKVARAAQAQAADPVRGKPRVTLDPELALRADQAARRFRAEGLVSKQGAAAMAELILTMGPTTQWLIEVAASVRRTAGVFKQGMDELADLEAQLGDGGE